MKAPIVVDTRVVAAFIGKTEAHVRWLVSKGVLTPVGKAPREGRGGRPRTLFDLRQVEAALGLDTPKGEML